MSMSKSMADGPNDLTPEKLSSIMDQIDRLQIVDKVSKDEVVYISTTKAKKLMRGMGEEQ